MIAKHIDVKFGLLLYCLNLIQEALTKLTVNLFFHVLFGKAFLLEWALDIQESLLS